MANTYFNYTDPVSPGDRLESSKYNGDFAAINRAFDVLPSPDDLASNTGNYTESTGTATAYNVILPKFDGSFGYLAGMQVLVKIHINNSGPATLNVNGLGPKTLVNLTTGLGPLVANDLRAGTIYSVRYDGTNFQVVNTTSGAIAATQTAATNAANSATAAATSATNAANSASSASSSAGAAAGSASSASTSATNASNSATAAAGSASSASTSATNATNSATAANNSKVAAATSQTAAANSATAAAGSASSASTSASAAATSATNAANSATAAAASATAANDAISGASFKNAVLNVLKTTTLDVGVVKFYALNIDPNTKYPGTTWVRLPVSQSIRTSLATAADVMTSVGSDTVTLVAANIPAHSHTGTATIASTDLGTKTSSSFDYGTKTSAAFNYGTITTSSFDYGTKTTAAYDFASIASSSSGAHTHTVSGVHPTDSGPLTGAITRASAAASITATSSTSATHTHTVDLPSHTHTVAIGAHSHTINLGSHSHTVAIGAHSHTVVMGTHNHTVSMTIGSTGLGQAFNIVSRSLILVGWRRTV